MGAFDAWMSWETVVMDYFRVEVERRNGLAVVRATGELDLASEAQLTNAIEAAGAAHAMVIDLAGVTYFDAGGVRVLLRARDDAIARGSSFAIRHVPRPVRRVLELAGQLDLLDDESQPAH